MSKILFVRPVSGTYLCPTSPGRQSDTTFPLSIVTPTTRRSPTVLLSTELVR